MSEWYNRTKLLLGENNFNRLQSSCVAIIGLGGVGGAAAEAICRAGVEHIIIMDHDTVDKTNINRQLIATALTVGMKKTDALKSRLLSINPSCRISTVTEFYNDQTKEQLFSHRPDFIIDAIDTVSSKLNLAVECKNRSIPLVSSMGTGNRLDPTQFKIGTIEQTAGCGCGLARVMRRELKRREVKSLPVLYSTEMPREVISDSSNGRHSPASISFCPPVGGYILAGYVINKIIE